LARLVPDVADRAAYVCGPVGMMNVLRKSLKTLGVPPDQIRSEVFRLQ
jgi:ferredoxin-NADP reductase